MFVLVTALLSRKFVSFVANHVDTKLFGGKARSRFRDLVVELEAELEAEQLEEAKLQLEEAVKGLEQERDAMTKQMQQEEFQMAK